MVNTTAMEQMTKYYWGMVGARAAAAASGATTATSGLRSSWPPPAHGGGEPSWEELAFARDAAGHLGGCVWPPRSYTCSFCRREFRSAQALGGHMNVHRRDRARLRLCGSPDHDVVQVQDTQQIQPIATPPVDHHHQDQQDQAPVFMAKAVLPTSPKFTWDHQSCYSKEEAVISTSPSNQSTNIKEEEKKKKVVILLPASAAMRKEALHSYEEEEAMVARTKRRRVDQPPEVVLPFFLRLPAPPCERVHEHDAKVPKVIRGPSSSSPMHLAGRQELDLELRLGSPKVA